LPTFPTLLLLAGVLALFPSIRQPVTAAGL